MMSKFQLARGWQRLTKARTNRTSVRDVSGRGRRKYCVQPTICLSKADDAPVQVGDDEAEAQRGFPYAPAQRRESALMMRVAPPSITALDADDDRALFVNGLRRSRR